MLIGISRYGSTGKHGKLKIFMSDMNSQPLLKTGKLLRKTDFAQFLLNITHRAQDTILKVLESERAVSQLSEMMRHFSGAAHKCKCGPGQGVYSFPLPFPFE